MATKTDPKIEVTKYTHRFLARFVIEAETPLAVGSGEKDIITDALVATDVNGLPYIPATAIAGVVRSMLGKDVTKEYFGYQEKKTGKGSEVIFTEAKILNSKGSVIDGLDIKAKKDNTLLQEYDELPVRQHVRIGHQGVTENAGKFDEQVVFAGTRFCFELEMVSDGSNVDVFEGILAQLKSKTFRIGGGTRCGFGKISVVSVKTRQLDLTNSTDLELYLSKSSNLAEAKSWSGWQDQTVEADALSDGWTEYVLELKPDDFFFFGSGFGDNEVDMTPVKEKKVKWIDGVGELSEELVLIPATSVKGALSHRVAFHYNKLEVGDKKPVYAENLSPNEFEKYVGKNNKAVVDLFGSEGEHKGDEDKGQVRGKLLFSDIIYKELDDKILNHVSIDRFTGGAMDGALFSEKTTYGKGKTFVMTILADNSAFETEGVKDALEKALKDICKGLLPLGGGVNRGNGIFSGSLRRDKEIIYAN